jgi:hypothetical protein
VATCFRVHWISTLVTSARVCVWIGPIDVLAISLRGGWERFSVNEPATTRAFGFPSDGFGVKVAALDVALSVKSLTVGLWLWSCAARTTRTSQQRATGTKSSTQADDSERSLVRHSYDSGNLGGRIWTRA